jgi:hyaluronan synthase
VRHVSSAAATFAGEGSRFSLVFTVAFALLVWQTVLAYCERARTVTPAQQLELDALNVVVAVPVYNEDPEALRRGLESLMAGTRRPQLICVVDDGSTDADYTGVLAWMVDNAPRHGVQWRWERQDNAGKRHAQGRVFASTPKADIYFTVDSDAIMDPHALDEALKPFADPKVQSVAGIVLALNNRIALGADRAAGETTGGRVRRLARNAGANLLCRMTDLWFVTGQLTDRSALSTMGSVLVNSGPLALYRAPMIRANLDGYLNETFFGRRVEFSDDSMLTIYALTAHKGARAVQQPTAFAFTLMPQTLGQHRRQYLRWMRGAFIRSWWRFKYLPLSSYAFWGHLLGWAQMAMGVVVFAALFLVDQARAVVSDTAHATPIWWLLLVPILVGYAQALRYMAIARTDEPRWSQWLTFALCPLATLWAFFVLRVVRWYAMATPLVTGWGTRQTVEITLAPREAT